MTSHPQNGINHQAVGGFTAQQRKHSPTKRHFTMGDNRTNTLRPQPLKNLLRSEIKIESLSTKSVTNPGCERHKCMGALMRPPPERPVGVVRPVEEVRDQAQSFLKEYYESLNKYGKPEYNQRLSEVMQSLDETGTYDHAAEELAFGAKTAWRNAPRCIGRIQWKNLKLIDGRHVKTSRDMNELLLKHLEYANNGGNIRSCITVFPKRTDYKHEFRVWNSQLISFAGYKNPDGTILGDPAYVEFAEMCMKLGWKPERTAFDVLPWVLQANSGPPEFFEIPKELILLVNISHPQYEWFADFKIKWYSVPAVANMLFDCGGIEYPAAPFNGWYMGTEVGSRDLCDPNRYNMLEKIGKKMGLDTGKNINLWKDRVLVEANLAVLHSYRMAGMTLVDHHTASDQFMSHLETEYRVRGGCPADWVWIVPPMSSSITPVFHMEMLHYKLKPSYEYQNDIWRSYKFGDEPERENKLTLKIISKALLFGTSLMRNALKKRTRCTILYATETGKSREFAKQMQKITSFAFNSRILCMDEYDLADLEKENLLLVIASTFGNGDPPDNGRSFYDMLKGKGQNGNKKKNPLGHIKFGVFGLGSSAYPSLCAFGHNVDEQLDLLGGERVYPVGEGDELQAQEESFRTWAGATFRAACSSYSIDIVDIMKSGVLSLLGDDMRWTENTYKILPQERIPSVDLTQALEYVHKKTIGISTVKASAQLQSKDSGRETLFVSLDGNNNPELGYEPGDHAAVFPTNDSALVEAILAKIAIPKHITPGSFFKLQRQAKKDSGSDTWHNDTRLPSVVSMRMALTNLLDITSPPSQQVLAQLAQLATSKKEKSQLERLAKDSSAYSQWRYDQIPNFLDILKSFPSAKVDPSFLLTQLPILQARYYSISSSPNLHPGDIHLTVAVVAYKSQGGRGAERRGVCSNWLNKLARGDSVRCFVRSATKFHLPERLTTPVLMVGPGTGVAPLRSFWQQRYVDKISLKKNTGPMTLYFGCRNRDKDNVYQREKSAMVKGGVIVEKLALSRDPDIPKTYVQDLLSRDGAMVYNQLVKEGGHVYVCGDVAMASDVRTIIEKIFQKHGSMTEAQAKEALETLRSSNNYHEDIFGTLKAPQPLLVKEIVKGDVDEKSGIITPPVNNRTSQPVRSATSPMPTKTTPVAKTPTQTKANGHAKPRVAAERSTQQQQQHLADSDEEISQTCSGLFSRRRHKKTHAVQGTKIKMSTNM